MPEGWEWDPTLFAGAAAYYPRGRLPYPPGLLDAFKAAADLQGHPRLVDVGCGPGTVALILAPLFTSVVGVDPDPDMIATAARRALEAGIPNTSWLCARAEDMTADLGRFRYATFAQSFHWMQRDQVARLIFGLLEPGGAFVHVDTARQPDPAPTDPPPHPVPPLEEVAQLAREFLGPVRRAGQGVLLHGTPGDEGAVLGAAGFGAPIEYRVPGGQPVVRTVDDLVAGVLSGSGTAPHLFGDRLPAFESRLRKLLFSASPSGQFSERLPEVWLVFYRRP